MKCPSCKFELENGTMQSVWDRKKMKYVYYDEYFFQLKGTFFLDNGGGAEGDLKEVDLVVCPKCGTTFVDHYSIGR